MSNLTLYLNKSSKDKITTIFVKFKNVGKNVKGEPKLGHKQ
ncbi:hypothetical protein PROPEN_00699 [Proteus penneri ATCC 35198]|nr:hypothetical protein PROPEN_00699 [Proteus penneri ATCC 35198]